MMLQLSFHFLNPNILELNKNFFFLLGLFICRSNCFIFAQWNSPTMITTITTRKCKTKGEVTVVTTGGYSQTEVYFNGFNLLGSWSQT